MLGNEELDTNLLSSSIEINEEAQCYDTTAISDGETKSECVQLLPAAADLQVILEADLSRDRLRCSMASSYKVYQIVLLFL